jgi:uncharacterized protein YfeS
MKSAKKILEHYNILRRESAVNGIDEQMAIFTRLSEEVTKKKNLDKFPDYLMTTDVKNIEAATNALREVNKFFTDIINHK